MKTVGCGGSSALALGHCRNDEKEAGAFTASLAG